MKKETTLFQKLVKWITVFLLPFTFYLVPLQVNAQRLITLHPDGTGTDAAAVNYTVGQKLTNLPGGTGVVFYTPATGEDLVVATTDLSSTKPWSLANANPAGLSNVTTTDNTWQGYNPLIADMDGYGNTQKIRAHYPGDAGTYAATAVDFANGWYLPSSGELTKLYSVSSNRYLDGISGYTKILTTVGNYYWSSTMSATVSAAAMNGLTGEYSTTATKTSLWNVRATRSATARQFALNEQLTVTTVAGASVQWYKDGVIISGATSNTYKPLLAGAYFCVVSKDGVSQTSKTQRALTVELPPVYFTITSSVGDNIGGTVSPLGEQQVVQGGDITFTMTANAGYSYNSLFIDGVGVTKTGNTYTFTNVQEIHTLEAWFDPIPEPFVVTPSTAATYDFATTTLTVTANATVENVDKEALVDAKIVCTSGVTELTLAGVNIFSNQLPIGLTFASDAKLILTTESDNEIFASSVGISAKKLTIEGNGAIFAVGVNNEIETIGILTDGDLIISGGTVKAIGNNYQKIGMGIFAKGDFTMNGGTFQSGQDVLNNIGIRATKNITFNDGNFISHYKTTSYYYRGYGLVSDLNNITINGGNGIILGYTWEDHLGGQAMNCAPILGAGVDVSGTWNYSVFSWEKLITISIDDTPQSFVYNGNVKAFVIVSDPADLSGWSVTYKLGETPVTNPIAAGKYDVTVTREKTEIYAEVNITIPNGLVITPITLNVYAYASTKVYGANDPIFTYSYEPSLIWGNPISGALAREEGEDVGEYAITIGTLSAGGNYVINFTSADLTITPIPTFTVHFSSNGGSEVPPITDVEKYSTIEEPTTPLKTGYTFVGWFKEERLVNIWDFDIDVVMNATTLFAKWNNDLAIPFEGYPFATNKDNVNFLHYSSSTPYTALTVGCVNPIEVDTYRTPDNISGYKFWLDEGVGRIDSVIIWGTTGVENRKINAIFGETISTFDGNNNNFVVTKGGYTESKKIVTSVAEIDNCPTGTLIDFSKLNTKVQSILIPRRYYFPTAQSTINQVYETISASNATFTDATVLGSQTNMYFAKVDVYITKNKYTVSFDKNGGTGGTLPNPITQSESGAAITIPAPSYEYCGAKPGYLSLNETKWATTENGTTFVNAGSYIPTADIMLYAVWEESDTLTVLTAAGKLAETIEGLDVDITDVEKMKVYGELNGTDLRTLRYMSGTDEEGEKVAGYSLEYLSMKNANFVAGGDFYLKNPASDEEMFAKKDTLASGTFYQTRNLKYVIIPTSITEIQDNVFGSGQELLFADLSCAATQIGPHAFGLCTSLKTAILPANTETIGAYSFSACRNLEKVIFPETLKIVENMVFFNCPSLALPNFPPSLESIGDAAFQGGHNLGGSVKIRATLSIGEGVFIDCPKLTYFDVDADHPDLADLDGVLFTKKIDTLIQVPGLIDMAEYTIPASVNYVCSYSFMKVKNIKKLTFPQTVKEVLSSTLFYSAIESVDFNADMDYVPFGFATFATNLKEVQLHEGITQISDAAFEHCHKLETINIPSTVETIGTRAFSVTAKLTTMHLSENLAMIYPLAFHAGGLESFTISEAHTNLKAVDGVIYNRSGTRLFMYPPGKNEGETFTVPESVQHIQMYSFESARLSEVIIPNHVTDIGESTFANMMSLQKIHLPESLTEITDYLLAGCGRLTEISVTPNIEKIGALAVAKAVNLPIAHPYFNRFNDPDNVLSSYENPMPGAFIAENEFIMSDLGVDTLPFLHTFTIPASVDSIKTAAFFGTQIDTVYSYLKEPMELPFHEDELGRKIAVFYLPETTYLYVPAGTLFKYIVLEQWQDFKLIEMPKEIITIDETPQSFVYSGEAKAFEVKVVSPVDFNDFKDFNVVYNPTNPTAAGTYDVTITREEDTTYAAFNKTIENGLVITKANVEVTAHNITKYEGSEDPLLTYSVTPELFNNDSLWGSLTREPGETLGFYPISLGTLNGGDNYTITEFYAATFTIIEYTAEARIGEVEYELLSEAIAAAVEGDIIYLIPPTVLMSGGGQLPAGVTLLIAEGQTLTTTFKFETAGDILVQGIYNDTQWVDLIDDGRLIIDGDKAQYNGSFELTPIVGAEGFFNLDADGKFVMSTTTGFNRNYEVAAGKVTLAKHFGLDQVNDTFLVDTDAEFVVSADFGLSGLLTNNGTISNNGRIILRNAGMIPYASRGTIVFADGAKLVIDASCPLLATGTNFNNTTPNVPANAGGWKLSGNAIIEDNRAHLTSFGNGAIATVTNGNLSVVVPQNIYYNRYISGVTIGTVLYSGAQFYVNATAAVTEGIKISSIGNINLDDIAPIVNILDCGNVTVRKAVSTLNVWNLETPKVGTTDATIIANGKRVQILDGTVSTGSIGSLAMYHQAFGSASTAPAYLTGANVTTANMASANPLTLPSEVSHWSRPTQNFAKVAALPTGKTEITTNRTVNFLLFFNNATPATNNSNADFKVVADLASAGQIGIAVNYKTLRTIQFVNYDNAPLQVSSFNLGEMPEYTGETPVKPSVELTNYKFIGWTPEVVKVAGDAKYTATFEEIFDPYISITPTSYDFGTQFINGTYTKDFIVTTAHLTSDLIISKHGSGFTFTPATIAQDATETTVTVTFAPTEEKEYVAIVQIAGEGINALIEVQGVGKDRVKPTLAINFPVATFAGKLEQFTTAITPNDYTGTPITITWALTSPEGAVFTLEEHQGALGWKPFSPSGSYSNIPLYAGTSTLRINSSTAGTYSFTMSLTEYANPNKVLATYTGTMEVEQLFVTATAGEGGAITPTGIVNVLYGANQTFTVNPNTGFEIDEITVNNVSQVPIVQQYTFNNVIAQGNTIDATFKLLQFAITFNNWNDVLLQKSLVDYGTMPVYTGETPTKPADDFNTYRWLGWNPALANVTETATYTATFTTVPKTVITINETPQSFVYDGNAQAFAVTSTPILTDFTVVYSPLTPTTVGSYNVTITRPSDETFAAFSTTIVGGLVITKATYDMSEVIFGNRTFEFDGTPKSIFIEGTLPADVSVSYEGNGKTEVGTHPVTASFTTTNSNYFNPPNVIAGIFITKATIAIDETTQIFTYDTYAKDFKVIVVKPLVLNDVSGFNITYRPTSIPLNAGSYDVIITRPSDDNYEAFSRTIVGGLIINKATYNMSGVTFVDKTFIYDGLEQTIIITGILPNGVSVSYINNKRTDVGTQQATARFMGDATNYQLIDSKTAWITIIDEIPCDFVEDIEQVIGTPNFNGAHLTMATGIYYVKGTTLMDANDRKIGLQSVRLRATSIEESNMLQMEFDKTDGIGWLRFDYASYSNHANGKLFVEYSTDKGATWVRVNPNTPFVAPVWNANTGMLKAKIELNIVGRVRVRIVKPSQTGNSTVNVDNLCFTDFGTPADPTYYTINATSTSGGIITPVNETQVLENSTLIYRIEPLLGYNFKDVLVDGKSVGAVITYTFTHIQQNHTIHAIFEQVPTPSCKVTEDFEIVTGTPNFAGALLTMSSGDYWVKGTTVMDASDRKIDTKSVRLRGNSLETFGVLEMRTPVNGVGKVKFNYASYGTHSNGQLYVEYSTNGTTWTRVNTAPIVAPLWNAMTGMKEAEVDVNVGGNVFIRIYKPSQTGNTSVNIDNLCLCTFFGPPPVNPLEITTIEKTTMSVYPNPTNSSITISLSKLDQTIEKIEIIDMTGKLLLAINDKRLTVNEPQSVDVSGLPNGIYFLRVTTSNEVLMSKVVKN